MRPRILAPYKIVSDDVVVKAIQAATVDSDVQIRQLIDEGMLVTSTELGRRLRRSPQLIKKGNRSGRYFSLKVAGRDYYPAFFAEPAVVNNGLPEVMGILHRASAWERWIFLTQPSLRLGGRSPVDALRSGRKHDQDVVKALARAQAGE